MNRVSRRPLGVLRAPASVALALTLLASLAPLATVARAQAPLKGQALPVAAGPAYVIEQTPDGEVSCRLLPLGEAAPAGEQTLPVRQINHLEEKESASTSASAGLIIVLRATPRLEANAEARQAFINAAAKWEALISTQITVTIDVDYGPDFFGDTSDPYGTNTLGQTSASGFIPSYASVRQRLINRAPAGSEEATLLNRLPASSLPTDVGNVETVFVTNALARALGYTFSEENNEATIPKIGFNTNFAFDFNPADGVAFNQTDFDSVAVHEIGHALGFNSQVGAKELNPERPLIATVWDFYRFKPGVGTAASFSTAQRILSSGAGAGDQHVHFSGGAELALSTGRPDGTGGDEEQASHWKDDTGGLPFIGIMDPTIRRGRHDEITANDLLALDFFGYSVGAVPAPANDNFASAQQLSGSAGRVTGTNRGASKEAGEPSHSDDPQDSGGRSVWYSWTAPSTGSVTFNTGQGPGPGEPASNFDTTLAAYTGASVGALTPVAKNDDVILGEVVTSTITFNAVGGTTYMIAVDGYDGDVGQIALNWNHTGGPVTVQFSSAAFSTGEGSGGVQITVTRAGGTGASFNVNYASSDGTATAAPNFVGLGSDYGAVSGTLQFGAGETSKTFTIFTVNDPNDETDETVNLTLSGPTGGVTLGTPSSAVLTIVDDDPGPTINVSDAFVGEGNAGTASAVFEVTLTAASAFPVSVNYATANGTATAGSDYVAASGTVSFAAGETRKTVSVVVNGDTVVEDFQETFFLDLSAPTNATLGDARGQGTIHSEESTPGGSVIEFGAASFTASETGRSATLTLTRTNPNSVTVDVGVAVRTVDNPAAVRCDDTTTLPGVAFARCDYLSTITVVTFAPGETTKTVTVPLVDDAHGEPNETVRVEIVGPGGALFIVGANSATNLVITSDEATGQTRAANPLDGNPFFVRLQYLDFLNREPEVGEPWTKVLDDCANEFNQDPQSPSALCDRVLVSYSFFGSPEFNLKGGFIFRFYKVSFGRMPEYSEMAADMSGLTGATAAELLAKRTAFAHNWEARAEFVHAHQQKSDAQLVNHLMDRYGLQQITTPDPLAPDSGVKVVLTRQQLIDRMALSGLDRLTRGRLVRAIADSDEVSAVEFRPSFVAMQYYGYLRRTPEPTGYQNWLNYLNQNPQDFRTMVGGFVNSQEYRLRFGQP